MKQEAREQQQQQEENVNSVEAAKRKLANLTNSISLGKPAQSSPTSFQLPASGEQITPRNQEILKQLMVTSSGSNKPAAEVLTCWTSSKRSYNESFFVDLTKG